MRPDEISMSEGRNLPEIYVRENDMPEISGWMLNSEQYIICKVSVEGKELVLLPGEKKLEARLKIKGFQAIGSEPIDIKKLKEDEFAKEKVRFLKKSNSK